MKITTIILFFAALFSACSDTVKSEIIKTTSKQEEPSKQVELPKPVDQEESPKQEESIIIDEEEPSKRVESPKPVDQESSRLVDQEEIIYGSIKAPSLFDV